MDDPEATRQAEIEAAQHPFLAAAATLLGGIALEDPRHSSLILRAHRVLSSCAVEAAEEVRVRHEAQRVSAAREAYQAENTPGAYLDEVRKVPPRARSGHNSELRNQTNEHAGALLGSNPEPFRQALSAVGVTQEGIEAFIDKLPAAIMGGYSTILTTANLDRMDLPSRLAWNLRGNIRGVLSGARVLNNTNGDMPDITHLSEEYRQAVFTQLYTEWAEYIQLAVEVGCNPLDALGHVDGRPLAYVPLATLVRVLGERDPSDAAYLTDAAIVGLYAAGKPGFVQAYETLQRKRVPERARQDRVEEARMLTADVDRGFDFLTERRPGDTLQLNLGQIANVIRAGLTLLAGDVTVTLQGKPVVVEGQWRGVSGKLKPADFNGSLQGVRLLHLPLEDAEFLERFGRASDGGRRVPQVRMALVADMYTTGFDNTVVGESRIEVALYSSASGKARVGVVISGNESGDQAVARLRQGSSATARAVLATQIMRPLNGGLPS